MVQNVVCDKTVFYVIGPLPDEVFS